MNDWRCLLFNKQKRDSENRGKDMDCSVLSLSLSLSSFEWLLTDMVERECRTCQMTNHEDFWMNKHANPTFNPFIERLRLELYWKLFCCITGRWNFVLLVHSRVYTIGLSFDILKRFWDMSIRFLGNCLSHLLYTVACLIAVKLIRKLCRIDQFSWNIRIKFILWCEGYNREWSKKYHYSLIFMSVAHVWS